MTPPVQTPTLAQQRKAEMEAKRVKCIALRKAQPDITSADLAARFGVGASVVGRWMTLAGLTGRRPLGL